MDSYTEQILQKKSGLREKLNYFISGLVLLAGITFVCFVSLSLGILLVAVSCFLFYYAKLSYDVEYEYIFTNGDCDIARIKSKEFRKTIYAFQEADVQRVMKFTSGSFQNELEVNSKLNLKDFTSGIESNKENWYAFMINGKDTTYAVVMELSDKSLEHITKIFKNKVQ